jgi:beta-glucosidase
MKTTLTIVLFLLTSVLCTVFKVPLFLDPMRSPNDRAEDLVKRMTLDEKIGQMTQIERNSVNPPDILKTLTIGSVLSGGGSAPNPNTADAWADMIDSFQKTAKQSRLGIPILYGSDGVHGHNNLYGAVLFPHNIGIGASRNSTLAQMVAQAAAEEIAGAGVSWTFAPCIATPRNERWGRTYEGFGEDPSIGTMMASMVTGFQTTKLGSTTSSILATAKHWVGDGGTQGGKDQGDTVISMDDLRKIHVPPYLEALKRGVGSVMISFNSINGTKCHGNMKIITDLLKQELKFQGFTVSDWMGIDQLSGDYSYAVRTSINAGLDMVMVPLDYNKFISTLKNEVQAGRVPESRINDAVTRILRVKFALGLFERPFADRSLTKTVGSKEHREIARDAVRQSLVLLKNEGNILPLNKNIKKLFVAGKSADDMGLQCGGWSITWQGGYGPITPGTTILQGIKEAVSTSTTVTYDPNANGLDSSYEAVIVIVGETPYAEGRGDRPDNLALDYEDQQTLDRAKQSGVPIITILVSGRPMIISDRLPYWKAFMAAWLPGTEGNGIADVLFGNYKPTGKLPHTWPRNESQIPINYGDQPYDPLFPFGFGLTYN